MKTALFRIGLVALFLASAAISSAEMRVSTSDAMKAAVTKATPTYPPMAKQMKVTGRVEVEVTIKEDGSVASAKPITGNALLTSAAVDAAKRWKFTPFQENGAPTTAVTVAFDFNM